MRVQTQFGMMEINPADVISIKPVSLWADNNDYYDLTYCVEYEDESAPNGRNTACVTEPVAKELSRISGVKIPEMTVIPKKRSNTIFVPFNQLLILNEWEKYFKNCVKGINQEPERKPAPSSFSPDNRTLYEENHQPISVIEQVFRAQNNCIQCGKLVYDESRICSSCSNEPGVIENWQYGGFPESWLYKSIKQGIIMNTEKSVKKNSRGKMQIVKIESHGTAYFIENKFLACCPLLIGGEPCMESSCIVEEAPKSYRDDHIKALRLLGIKENEIDSYLKNVNYYDE